MLCDSPMLPHINTVVGVCRKGDKASKWKKQKFDHSPREQPLTNF